MSDDYTHGDNVADHDYLIYPPVVNGNPHLDNMEVVTYDNLHIVTESPEPGTVRVTIYKGTDPVPLSKETYGHENS